ncbi:MAG: hypothetical protein CVV56_05755 [Tenericutes bacterium HGW-Tenericutes-1]|jgi:AcrR family transcriptional regulator|nr:MAG: hypothetical protein CVV56_05755 [Tenericutes bacterium HGW-Tenericutes-1]PKM56555.1 MAG: hypothetical protein CVU98_10650 [Firmicutes bacterium HGW-Firmicutes-3]
MTSLQQAKYDLVLENIKSLFLEAGINTFSISDIAKKIEIGEATIYRYFTSRVNLIIQVGISLWKDIYNTLKQQNNSKNGYESVSTFFHYFIEGYESHKPTFVFLDQFDSLIIQENISKDALLDYDQTLYLIKKLFDHLFSQGVIDGSIKGEVDSNTYYYTTTHMILGICKKLASNGNMLHSDEIVKDTTQIKMALDICLEYIKRK